MIDAGKILVIGDARSGTSLTMQMLNAGGIPCIGRYPSFEIYGYGETPYNEIPPQTAVKVLDLAGKQPPPGSHRIIICSRDFTQQAKSQVKVSELVSGRKLPGAYVKHLEGILPHVYARIRYWADQSREKYGSRVLELRFEDTLKNPLAAAQALRDMVDPLPFNCVEAAIQVQDRTGSSRVDMALELALIRKSESKNS